MSIDDMKLQRSRLHDQFAYRWTSPNDTNFYFYRVKSKWFYQRKEWLVSSLPFDSLEKAKADLVRYFDGE